MKHWTSEERGKFVSYVRSQGMQDSHVREALDVGAGADYEGSYEEAVALADGYLESVEEKREADYLAQCRALPESPGVAWTYLYSPGGYKWSFTMRAGLSREASRRVLVDLRLQIESFEKVAGTLGWLPVNGATPAVRQAIQGSQARSPQSQVGVPSTVKPPGWQRGPAGPPGGPPPPPRQAQAAQGNGGQVRSGVARLNAIKVDADGRVEFHVDGFRWPFKDSRGGEVVAGLFDEGLGWEPERFHPGANYAGQDVVGLKVSWAKPGQYYDVVQVHE